jgi:ribose transport system permease protein
MTETVKPTIDEAPAGKGRTPSSAGFQRILQLVLHERPLLLIALIAILSIFMSIFFPTAFPKGDNFAAVLLDTAQGGILAIGMMLMLVSGVFDLSVGSTLAFAGIVAGILVKDVGAPPLIAFAGGILTGTIIGAINGLVITRLRINAFITTLAMQGILRGVTQLASPSGVANLPEGFKPFGQTTIIGLQSPFWVMIIVAALAWFAMSRMRYFRQFYYVGANLKAAALSGIKVDKVLLVGFILMGTLAGLAGTLLASRLSNAVVLAGVGTELRAITAGLLGGASLSGGAGTIPGAILGVLFVSLIQNALIIARVPVFWQSIVVGIVLLVAIGVDQLSRRKQ